MHALFYRLEDHFEALSEQSKQPILRSAALRLSLICAGFGDRLAVAHQTRAFLAPPPDGR